jgi:tRNA dimethylallyltransferase
MNKENKIIIILGPTASGKTKIAAHVAKNINGEIISADSRQVYRDMNLGTGKDYNDYIVDGAEIQYHLIDIKQPGEKYNVYEYQKDFLQAREHILNRNKIPVVCGGTGMYIQAVTQGYKLIHVPVNDKLRNEMEPKSHDELIEILGSIKKLHNVSDIDTKKRTIRAIEIERYYRDHPETDIEFPNMIPLFIGIRYHRDNERKNITNRLKQRLENGMIEEVESLFDKGLSYEDVVYYGLEYKFIAMYLRNILSRDEMFNKLNTAIHQFAKRQRTWFRKMEREGMNIQWIEGEIPFEKKVHRATQAASTFIEN